MQFSKLFLFASAIVFSSCQTIRIFSSANKETVSPTAFKVQIPFIHPKGDRLFIPVFFEKENITRTLLFDSHAPMCLSDSILTKNPAYTKVGKYYKSKPTPDGQKIPNVFFKTDNIMLGNIRFNKVLISQIPDRTDTVNFRYKGIFGTNLMRKGVWKIDFERNQFTFASSIDSLENVADAQKLAVTFEGLSKIKADLLFENNVKIGMELDLGPTAV
jgi:hypothetical protein